MFEKFARTARIAVEQARHEAERRGDNRIGTDHLLVALLRDDAVAQLVGVNASEAARAADDLDRSALAALGLDVGEYPLDPDAALGRRIRAMTSGSKTVIRQALAKATTEKARTITARHLLLALLNLHEPDPAATLLAQLPIDQSALIQRLHDK